MGGVAAAVASAIGAVSTTGPKCASRSSNNSISSRNMHTSALFMIRATWNHELSRVLRSHQRFLGLGFSYLVSRLGNGTFLGQIRNAESAHQAGGGSDSGQVRSGSVLPYTFTYLPMGICMSVSSDAR